MHFSQFLSTSFLHSKCSAWFSPLTSQRHCHPSHGHPSGQFLWHGHSISHSVYFFAHFSVQLESSIHSCLHKRNRLKHWNSHTCLSSPPSQIKIVVVSTFGACVTSSHQFQARVNAKRNKGNVFIFDFIKSQLRLLLYSEGICALPINLHLNDSRSGTYSKALCLSHYRCWRVPNKNLFQKSPIKPWNWRFFSVCGPSL